jgi:hypothetical protein
MRFFDFELGVNLRDFPRRSLDVEELTRHFIACDGEASGFCVVLQ